MQSHAAQHIVKALLRFQSRYPPASELDAVHLVAVLEEKHLTKSWIPFYFAIERFMNSEVRPAYVRVVSEIFLTRGTFDRYSSSKVFCS